MPIQNDNVIISPNDFLENNKKGEFYTGYVFGLGYAFVQHFPVEVFSGTDLSGMFEQYQKQPILSFCQMNEAVILSNRAQFLVYTYVFVGYHSKCLCL